MICERCHGKGRNPAQSLAGNALNAKGDASGGRRYQRFPKSLATILLLCFVPKLIS
jgi:hypothetical protein